jgi:hypothetical protein
LHEIVGDAVTSHLTGLGDEVSRELTVDDPVDWVKDENTASNQSTLQFVNELVIPGICGVTIPEFLLVGGLWRIHVSVLGHDPESFECVGDDGSLRRTDNVELSAQNDYNGSDGEHAYTQQICRPETHIALHVWGGQQRKGTSIDTTVEDQVDTLNGDGGIDDDSFTRWEGLDGHSLPGVLIGNQRADVGFDTSGPDSDDENGGDETTHPGTILERDREGRQQEDEQTDHIDTAGADDGPVFSNILIRENGTKDWSDCRVLVTKNDRITVVAYQNTRN